MAERRWIIIGAGAIGGALAGQLVPAGHDVVLVARGEHAERIRAAGLTVRRPDRTEVIDVPVVTGPEQVALRRGDVLVLATKAQDAERAIGQWAWRPVEGGGPAADLPIVTCQNGLAAEDAALRRFRHVVGATFAIAASYLTPGEVVSPSRPPAVGVVWVGRHPCGPEELGLARDWTDAGFAVIAVDDIGRYKAAKLIGNVANALDLLSGSDELRESVREALRAETRAVFEAARIGLPAGGALDIGATGFTVEEVPGHEAGRLSTWQSFARGAGGNEVDHLNGEVVLLGRRHGIATPVNEQVQRLLGSSGGGRLEDVERAASHALV